MRSLNRLPARAGFTLVEAMLATVITTVAGGALLAALAATVTSSDDLALRTVAQGMANQLMDEIAAARFPDAEIDASLRAFHRTLPGEPRDAAVVWAENGIITTKESRLGFLTLDDYHGWSASPPSTREGYPLGTAGRSLASTQFRHVKLQPLARHLSRFTRSVVIEKIEISQVDGQPVLSFDADAKLRRVTVTVDFTDASGETRTLAKVERLFARVPNNLP